MEVERKEGRTEEVEKNLERERREKKPYLMFIYVCTYGCISYSIASSRAGMKGIVRK